MKRICILLCLLMLCGMAAGCDRTEPPVPTVPVTVPTEPTAEPVPEDAFFFSNALEFYRLYCQTPGEEEPRLVLDEICDTVHRRGNTVYFMQNQNLYSLDISTSQKQCVQENVNTYALAGPCLLYSKIEADYRISLHWRNLETGDGGKICTEDYVWFTAGDGYGYYMLYNNTYDSTEIYSLNIATGESKRIREDYVYGYSMIPMEDGVLYSFREDMEDVWIYVSADGEYSHRIPSLSGGEPFYATKEQILYIKRDYGMPGYCQVRRLSADGEDTLLTEADPNAYYDVHPLGDGRFLLEHYAYVEWGPVNEYGYWENYSLQMRYYLLDSDGTLSKVNATGTAGAMFAGGDFPVIDSSTARKPVTAELYNLFVKNFCYEGPEPLCSTTHGAWLNIADGTVDLALLAAPTPEEQAYLDQKGVEVEMKLYGGDGLVFIGNKENPVSNITHDQLLAIYRGEITNWKELGGPDEPITVYFRDDQSGSQRLFEELVWKDKPVPDFYTMGFDMMDEMSSIVYVVQENPYSIGYSIMTYLDDVYGEDALRVFSINGVAPSAQTIADGSYPYHTKGYLVIRSDEPAGSPARRLYDWFGCAVSDELLHRCGITPLHE